MSSSLRIVRRDLGLRPDGSNPRADIHRAHAFPVPEPSPEVEAEVRRFKAAEVADLQRRRAATREQWALKAGIPGGVVKLLVAGKVDPARAWCKVVQSLLRGRSSLGGLWVIVGGFQVGKTFAAANGLWQERLRLERLQQAGRPVSLSPGRFVRSYEWCHRAAWEAAGAPERRVPLLVVDDFGFEPAEKRASVEELLLQRFEDGLDSLVTTNAEDFESTCDGRLLARTRSARGKVVRL